MFAADGAALAVASPTIVATPPQGPASRLELLAAGTGHVVANVQLTPGTWRFDISCVDADSGATLRSALEREIGTPGVT